MCSRGLQATLRLLIIDFEGEVCDLGPLGAANRITKMIPDHFPQIWPHLITLGASFKYIKH